MKDYTKAQAKSWVAQELAKITTLEQAEANVAALERSKVFFNSPQGIQSGKLTPNSRQARFDLTAAVKEKFGI